MTLNVP
jgi:chromosome segregation ATPase